MIRKSALAVALMLATCTICKADDSSQLSAKLKCSALSHQPHKNPKFDILLRFTRTGQKLSASRKTKIHPGAEDFLAEIDASGAIRVEGRGAWSDRRSGWRYDLEGRVPPSGPIEATGGLVSVSGGKRHCTMVFLASSDVLRQQFNIASHNKAASPNTTNAKSDASNKVKQANPVNAASPANEATHRETAVIEDLENIGGDLHGQIKLLQALVQELRQGRNHDVNPSGVTDSTIKTIQEKLAELERRQRLMGSNSPAYTTPIRPDDAQSFPTARAVSEDYPPIPYYINGTSETGDFWVLPEVSEKGELQFKIRLIDFNSPTDKVRSEIVVSTSEIEQMADSLQKLWEWSVLAHDKRIRREFEKRVVCFPAANCPIDGSHVDGQSSVELIFHVDDEGETNGAIRRNKGKYVESYNFSIPSGLMLRAYMIHVINEAKLEYQAGTETKDQLNQMFK